jgi:hypothetical protein
MVVPHLVSIPVFVQRYRGIRRETTVTTVGVQAEIRTENLPNTSLERYRYANPPPLFT